MFTEKKDSQNKWSHPFYLAGIGVITHILHSSSKEAMDANHCHLEPAYGLAPSWGNGWGVFAVSYWVIGNQQLGGRPPITLTNLALISSPARFHPFPPHAPNSAHQTTLQPAYRLTFFSHPASTPGNSFSL